jgi:hypothetical protein
MVMILPVIGREDHLSFIPFEHSLDFVSLGLQASLKLPFKALPFFRDMVQGKAENADRDAYRQQRKAGFFEYFLRKDKYKFDYLDDWKDYDIIKKIHSSGLSRPAGHEKNISIYSSPSMYLNNYQAAF